MRTILVTRHPGMQEWMVRRHHPVDRIRAHIDPGEVVAGDIVIGTLPVALVAELCTRGAAVYTLCLSLPEAWRGRELSADEIDRLGGHLRRVTAVLLEPGPPRDAVRPAPRKRAQRN